MNELRKLADRAVPASAGHAMFRLIDVVDALCKQFSAAGIEAVIGSPNPAEDLHARAILALGGTVNREHLSSVACWCQPEANYTDPDSGATVYVHKEIQ